MNAHVCFLFHMHQPAYVDPMSGRAELPWVRLHGARAYLDVATALAAHPPVHLTVNFVPSLLSQLEEVVAGARDAWLELDEKPAGEWTPEERTLLVGRLFSIHWARAIEPRPRYRELLERRGRELKPGELAERAARFTAQELRDLTVLFNLSWIGFAARSGDRELEALEKKGRDYDEADLALVIARQRAACEKVLPLWRELAARGQVELSSSPYFHPIVPLVIDTETARRSRPDLPEPSRFAWAEDAAAQIRLAQEAHARVFGAPPVGMWPPEGSFSPEAVELYAQAGVRWLATDEGNLWRSLALAGREGSRGDLYRAYRHLGVELLFRDRELSDRIGFAYAHGDPRAGAADLLARARHCATLSTAPAGEPKLVPIFLDGENPWEAYPESGRSFLDALFSGLARDPELRATSIREHLEQAPSRRELGALHSGSWIDSDFHIWIGDPVKNRAWELLGRVRRQFERARAGALPAARLDRAYRHLLAAEGSDWFWWFGEPFHSAEDAIFDRLFRAHLAGALTALGEPIFDELSHPVAPTKAAGGSQATTRAPTALIRPRIGEPGGDSFYAWHGAGIFQVPRGAAMADSPLVERIHFGFDRATLYLRLDLAPGGAAELTSSGEVTLEVIVLEGDRRMRLRLPLTKESHTDWILDEAAAGGWRELAHGGPTRIGRAIELGVPFARLGLAAGARATLAFQLWRGELSLARYPSDGAIPLTVPDDAFEARNWWA
ncbi:MAG TPA: glycoside hydrolase family 57 protein [Polyangia bacterium]